MSKKRSLLGRIFGGPSTPARATVKKTTPAKKVAPKKAGLKKSASKKAAPKKVAPKKVAPKKVAPKRLASKKAAPPKKGASTKKMTSKVVAKRVAAASKAAPRSARTGLAARAATPAARARARAQAAAAKAKAKAAADRAKTKAAAARARAAREAAKARARAARAAAQARAAARRAAERARATRLRAAARAKAAKAKEQAKAKIARAKAAAQAAREKAAAKAAREAAKAAAKAAREAAKAEAKAAREATRAAAKAAREAAKAEAKAAREATRLARSLARGSGGRTSRGARITRAGGASGAADRALSVAHATLARRSLMPAHLVDLTIERLQELQPGLDPDLALLIIELIEDEVPTQSEIVAAYERWVADRPEGEPITAALLTDTIAAIGLEPAAERAEGDEIAAIVGAFALQSAVAPVPLSEIQEAFEKMVATIDAAGGTVPTIERFIGAIAAAGVQIDDEERDDELPAETISPEQFGSGSSAAATWDAYSQWRREVANHKILSREEETEITHRYAFYRSSVESLTASLARLDEQIAVAGGVQAIDPAEAARRAEIAALMAADPEAAAALRASGIDVTTVMAPAPAAVDARSAELLAERATIVTDIEAARAAMSRTEDYFLRCNYKLVLKHARAFYEAGRRRIDLMDLVQQGNTGMVEAFRRFDPTRGFKFSTFATFHIKQKISEWARERGSSIRIPTFRQREWARLNAYKAEFYNAHGRQPSDEEMAEKFGKTEKKIKEIFAAEALSSPSSIDKPVSEEDGAATMGELIEDNSAINPEEHLIRTHVASEIADALMRCLTPRERRVIQSRFGLYTGSRETLEEIGRRMRITRERVRQIEARALEKLRADETIRGMEGSKAGFAGVPWAITDEQD